MEELLRLLKLIGGKFVIVEDGQPKAVLMDFEEFEKLAVPYYADKLAAVASKIEAINQEIIAAQAEDLKDLREEVIVEPEIRIEPLDFEGVDPHTTTQFGEGVDVP